MVELGKMNTLRVVRIARQGAYLEAHPYPDVLLPTKEAQGCEQDEELNVFLYLDSEDRLIASRKPAYAQAGEFACLRVAGVNRIGAFLDWGLPKDLLVPFREQTRSMEVDRRYLVYVYHDTVSNRLAASSRIDRYLDTDYPDYQPGQPVNLLTAHRTDLGVVCIVDNRYKGLLFHSDIFKPLRFGTKTKGYIKEVHPDGKITVSLEKTGQERISDNAQKILNRVQSEGGSLALTDKSPPEEIYATLGMSKKTFKEAIGTLYKQRLIVLEPHEIRLSNSC